MPTVKRTNDEWRALLAEQRASGQAQAAWCAANGVNLYTLRDRASRLKRMDRETEPRSEQPEAVTRGWMEIKSEMLSEAPVDMSIARGGFIVTIKSGFDAEQLTEVLRAVSRVCC